MDLPDDLRSRAEQLAAAVPWHHSIELFPDLVTRGTKSVQALAAETAAIFGFLRLEGRSVLDVGAWNGHFSFAAKRHGAARVLATDAYTWRHPGFRGRETLELARECLALDVETREIDAHDLPADLGTFDIVLFLGVFYHVFDPLAVTQNVAAMARDLLVIETDLELGEVPGPAMRFWPRSELGGDITNWWSPNAECMYELLRTLGFAHVCFQRHPSSARRGIFHAFRDSRVAVRYLLRGADDRILFDLDGAAGRAQVFAAPGGPAAPHPQAAHQSALVDRLADTCRELEGTRAELRRLKRSFSWRLTRPLRLITKDG